MSHSFFESRSIPRELVYWTIAVTGCSLPSLCIALEMGFPPVPIVLGIGIFILGFTLLTSTTFYHQRRRCLLGRVVRKSVSIRLWISIASLPLVLISLTVNVVDFIHFTPDFWCGFFAFGILHHLGFGLGQITSSIPGTLALTVLEGFFMAATLALIFFLVYFSTRLAELDRRVRG